MSDGSAQLEVNTASRRLRECHAEHFRDHLEGMRELSLRQAIPLLQIDTTNPVLDQVRDQLGHRAAARRV